MGVHGLWELLAPVGRRVSVETLAGKTLAVDASIWMVQFVKAMRDEKGEMVRNAHLLGFFRRICKLLFLRTKPVFVFDGGTPALKRRTVIARRRQRENAQAKVRKTAEKLLLNHLKALRLKELADDIKNQTLKQKSGIKGQEKCNPMDLVGNDLGRSDVKELEQMSAAISVSKEDSNLSASCNQEELDEMLAASIAAEENEILARKDVASTVMNSSQKECDADEETILPPDSAEVDLAVLAALPHSMQLDILAQLKGKKTGLIKEVDNQIHVVSDSDKGKGILFNETDMVGSSSRCDNVTSRSDNQDKIDEMLAASIDAEENAKLVNNLSSSVEGYTNKEEDDDYDEDEEMILPAMHHEVDPAVLASLPPSMQLDLLVQMRERLIAENRQKYQKVKKDPAKFSELQIQAYLKTVAFRREIDGVQKAAVGGGVGGVQTSRIASEANREYIFSSSFTGDKQELTSTRVEKNIENTQHIAGGMQPSQSFASNIAAGNCSNTSDGLVCNEPSEPVDESIQTYLDERGRFRVSRVRAMGMRMTRDIQRNLDLMKEIEQERTHVNNAANIETQLNTENNGPSECSGVQLSDKSQEVNADIVVENVQNDQSVPDRDTSIDISFEYDCNNDFISGVDDIFASLVGGDSTALFHADDTAVEVRPSGSDSDCDWEEGIIEGKDTIFPGHNKVELKSSVADEQNKNESEEECVKGDCIGTKSTLSCPAESGKLASKGCLEEESDLQEAIRRSLESIPDGKLKRVSSEDELSISYKNRLDPDLEHGDSLCCSDQMDLNDNSLGGSNLSRDGGAEQNDFHKIVDRGKKQNSVTRNNPQNFRFHGSQSASFVTINSNNTDILIDEPNKLDGHSSFGDSISDENSKMKDAVPTPMVAEKLSDKHDDNKVSFSCNDSHTVSPLGVTEENKKKYINESEPLSNSTNNNMPAKEDLDRELKLPSVKNDKILPVERNSDLSKDSVNTLGEFPTPLSEVRLQEEIQILDREYMNLENEQRKLERNAESVNIELFTECQELLQMFGLPYIIAPMEAEAQCAYLERAKLVDGVVTDDSDVLLFGARSVYKNIFDDRKYVETYFMKDVEKELGLTREKLIRMALLLGSDYTEGVSGIGIVNAIEVLNAFPEEDGLLKFRKWVESPDPTILGRLDAKTGSNTRKKGLKVEDKIKSPSDQNISHPQEEKEPHDDIQEITRTFMDKHRNVSKNWHIPSSFPSETVISAYLSPHVDKSTDPLAWGKPDHLVLRKLCWEKFGWTAQKADELLLPVLKEYNKHETQLRLEAFYSFNERFAKIRSNRIKKAVKGITGKQPSDLIDDSAENLSESRKKKGGSVVEPGDDKLEISKGIDESLAGRKKSKTRESTKRKNDGDTVAKAPTKKKKFIDDPSSAPATPATEEEQHDDKALVQDKNGRGRRRGRGRGRGIKRGREKESLHFESCETETSSSGSDNVNHGPRAQVDASSKVPVVRKSMRSRKPVDYSFKDLEDEDDDEGSFDQNNQNCFNDEIVDEKISDINDAPGDGAIDSSELNESNIMELPLKDNFPLPADDLESEALFSMDACATAGTGNCDNSFDFNPSDDYLKIGGGFCVDDSEMDENHDAVDDTNTATMDSTADVPSHSDFLGETDRDKSSSDMLFSGNETAKSEKQDGGTSHEFGMDPVSAPDMGVLMPENAHNQNSGSSSVAFSAMPFLKKRRKR